MAQTPLTPESSAAHEASALSGEPAVTPASDPGLPPGGEGSETPVISAEVPKPGLPVMEESAAVNVVEVPDTPTSLAQSAPPLSTTPERSAVPSNEPISADVQAPAWESGAIETNSLPTAAVVAPPAGIAARLEVTPQAERPAGAEGGEWELLLEKGRRWLDAQEIRQQWQSLWGPVRGLGLLLGLILVLRVYGALLGTLEEIPLLPRLLQLLGLLVLARFGLSRLLRTEDRVQVLNDWRQRWQAFRGEP